MNNDILFWKAKRQARQGNEEGREDD